MLIPYVPFPEETFDQYRRGGYHPIALGDKLKDGRYTICHKLAHGSDATVWVARDSMLNQWVSIKIKTADRTEYSTELEILKDLQKQSGGRDRDYVIQLLDDFNIQGPNGRHQALVFEMMGPAILLDVEMMEEEIEMQDAEEILDISSQLLQALDFVHKAGHVHGDLNLTNLVRTSKYFPNMSYDALFEMLGAPEKIPFNESGDRPDNPGIPEHIVMSPNWDGWPLEGDEGYEESGVLRLFGFEEVAVKRTEISSLRGYCLGDPWATVADCVDYRADLWAAGVFMHHLIFPRSPMKNPNPGEAGWSEGLSWDAPELPWEWGSKWESLELEAPMQTGFAAHGPLMSPHWALKFREDVQHSSLIMFLPVMKSLAQVLPWERSSIMQALASLETGWEKLECRSKL